MKLNPGINQVVVAASAFLVLCANAAFFRNVLQTFSGFPRPYAHALSLAIVLFCTLLILLSLICYRRTVKPVLVLMFLLSAFTAYFMDSYNVIIDHDMVANAMATDVAEVRDQLTPRLLLYLLLGILPSAFVLRINFRPQPIGAALRSRATLAASALLVVVALIFLSSGFYASFFREHKALRYYTNPISPLYAAYRFST